MQCRVSRYQSEDSREYPCGVCRKGGENSILCVECHRLVHKRCSGISGKLKNNVDFHCRRCLEGENDLLHAVLQKDVVIEPNVKLECVPKFCYLGDALGAGAVGRRSGFKGGGHIQWRSQEVEVGGAKLRAKPESERPRIVSEARIEGEAGGGVWGGGSVSPSPENF